MNCVKKTAKQKVLDHWHTNLLYALAGMYLETLTGMPSCEYCNTYNPRHESFKCGRCPVRRISGAQHCCNTPWIEVDKILLRIPYSGRSTRMANKLVEAIIKEIHFLETT